MDQNIISDRNGLVSSSIPQDSGSISSSRSTPRFNRLTTRKSTGHSLKDTTEPCECTRLIDESSTVPGSSEPSNSETLGCQKAILSSWRPFLYYIVYAIVNVIISVPGLYGYAAIIFKHPIFLPHMNTLAKLVIFSSAVHQLSFTSFSSLNTFAIGTVQDAGLIFLSTMANTLATAILNDDGSEAQVISTVLVMLSLSTASLGMVLIAMGHFRLADAVSYLPMPVVGGYLAFIGYFCLEAGVGLAISNTIINVIDWSLLFQPSLFVLAAPALVAGFVLTWVSRNVKKDAALPLAMVLIPGIFYIIIFLSGVGMDGARSAGWMGEASAPVPFMDLFRLVDFTLIRWDLMRLIFPTWVGMVFVVSFASCLDVAAIAMDMGEALDTNRELATVGIGNLLSGLTLGFTGSYIFSQTIFTYRTGVHSRWIGIFIILVFSYVIASPMNILEVVPLFFLGSTLIFIGYDLLYEWLFEIRGKFFLSEYCIVWATFLAIQVVGMDAGIVIGVLVSIVGHVIHSAKTTGVYRLNKKSRAVWTPEQYKLLQDHGYNLQAPKIVTLEIAGNIFFGSSLRLLQRIVDELGVSIVDESIREKSAFQSPHASPFRVLKDRRPSVLIGTKNDAFQTRPPPKYLTIDLSRLHNIDASASRGCFLQLVRICSKRGILVCACNASARVEWMLRSHDVAYDVDEEQRIKDQHLSARGNFDAMRLLLFVTIHEALEFCENALIQRMGQRSSHILGRFSRPVFAQAGSTLSSVFSRILGSSGYELETLNKLNFKQFHQELVLQAGQDVFLTNTNSDAFYVVLKGAVALRIDEDDRRYREKSQTHIVSGAGLVRSTGSISNMVDSSLRHDSDALLPVVTSVWPVGGVFGYVDFLLERPRHFRTMATQNDTIVAKITMADLRRIQKEDPVLDGLVQRVLLQASLLDLANCTCEE